MKLPYEQADRIVRGMTLPQKVGQLIMASIEVTQMDDATRAFLRENYVGSIILFGKNCVDRAQMAQLNREIQKEVTANTGVQALLSIDQEGGRVLRIRKGASIFPGAMAIGSLNDPEKAYLTGRMEGHELRSLGIALDCAPVLDVSVMPDRPKQRCYGTTSEKVALFGTEMVKGLQDSGVIACGKHFPGSGYSRLDTHFDFSAVDVPEETIRTKMLAPFRAAMKEGLGSVMTTHVCYPALEPERVPATMSRNILRNLLRDEMGFEGLVISDGLQMHAISKTYGAEQGGIRAVAAGCDLIICGNGGDNASADGLSVQTPCVQALIKAAESGELPMERVEESARRVVAFKLAMGDMRPADDVETQDWTANQAYFDTLAYAATRVMHDNGHVLPVGEKALFVCEKPRDRFGVLEGDRLQEGFAAIGAATMHGTAYEYVGKPDLDEVTRLAAEASAVVIGLGTEDQLDNVAALLDALSHVTQRVVVVSLHAPYYLTLLPQAPCGIYSCDQTIPAIHAVCRRLCE